MNTDSSATLPRVAVIGGGIAGLAAAHRLIELGGWHVDVFEAGSTPGGLLETTETGDFLVERGADAFITNKPAAIDLCRRLGLEDRLIGTDERFRRSLVLHQGRPCPVPDGLQLLMPTRMDAVRETPLLSDAAKQRVADEACIPPAAELRDESVASFVRRRFGVEWFDRIAQPMVGGIYTADPEQLSLLATLPRFLQMEQEHGSLLKAAENLPPQEASGARYGLFVSLRGGISELVTALSDRVQSQASVWCEHPIESVSRAEDGRWQVTGLSATQSFDAVVLALPAWASAQLISDLPELATELRSIPYASSAIVCTAHRLADIEHDMSAFGLVVPAVENRRVLAVSFSSRKFSGRAPDDCILLRTFLGGATQPELLDHSDSKLTEIVLEELSEIFGVSGSPLLTLVTRYERAMPQYHLGHVERVARIRDQVAMWSGLELAGNAFEGVGIPDAVRSGEEAAARLCAAGSGL